MKTLKFLSVLFLSVSCFGQGAHRVGQVLARGNGVAANVVPNATIKVCVSGTGCGTEASIFADVSLTSPLSQPVVSDSAGNYNYYIAGGCVDELVSAPAQGSKTTTNICPFSGTTGVPGVTTLNGLTGNINITAGNNITVTPIGNNIQIASTAGSGTVTGSGTTGQLSAWTSSSSLGNATSGQLNTLAQSISGCNAGYNSYFPISGKCLPSVIPVSAYGAVGDNSTDNTSAFTTMESSAQLDFFLPIGSYKTTQTSLSKHYWGPGSIYLGAPNAVLNGNADSIQARKSIGLDGLTYASPISAVDIQVLGDSLTSGYVSGTITPTNYIYAVPYRLQQVMANKSDTVGQGGWMSGPSIERLVTTGSPSIGTRGQLARDIILHPGDTASVTVGYVKNAVITSYNAVGGGTMTLTGTDGVWGTCNTSIGTGEVKCGQMNAPNGNNYVTQTLTMSCASGPCELTNFVFATLPTTGATTNFVQAVANGGYSTANFVSSAVLDSIALNRMFKNPSGNFSIAVIALGTNNIYNAATATTSAVYKSQLQTIVTGLKSRGIAPYLVAPPIPSTSSSLYSQPVIAGETYANYWNAVYQVAAANEVQVIDLSNLDLAGGALYGGDGLHPTEFGYGAIADFYLGRYGFQRMYTPGGDTPHPQNFQALASSAETVSHKDTTGVIRGAEHALNGTTSPVTSWPVGSFVMEGITGNTIVSAFSGNLKLQTAGRTVDALTLTPTAASSTLPWSLGTLQVGGGPIFSSTSVIPTVGTPTVGKASCIKAAGPPVVIGFCSTVVDAAGACTCN